MKPIKFSLSLAAGIFLLANFCLAQSRYVYSVAGNGQFGFSGDNGPALNAQIDAPRGLCKDVEGNLYISDGMNSRIRKVNVNTGAITTYAGNGGSGYSGNGGLAVNAQIGDPQGICLDNAGNLYIADRNGYIRKVDKQTGIITTVAGGGTFYFVDGVLATDQLLNQPFNVAVDASGNIYIPGGYIIRKVDAQTGIITTVVSSIGNSGGYSGDGGPAVNAQIDCGQTIALDNSGNIYFSQGSNFNASAIRKVDVYTGIITTIAGNSLSSGYSGDGGPAINALLDQPGHLSIDAYNNIYFFDQQNNSVIRKIEAGTGIITTIAGDTSWNGSNDEGALAINTAIPTHGMFADIFGNVYFSKYWDRVRVVTGDSSNCFVPATNFGTFINKQCQGPQLLVAGTAGTSVKTYFGDGASDVSDISNGYVAVHHAYGLAGTYTIKQVLYNGTTAIDSLQFSYEQIFCSAMSVKFYNDVNSNCVFDQGVDYEIYQPITTRVDTNGVFVDSVSSFGSFYYYHYGHPGDICTFTVSPPVSGLSPTCPSSGIINDTLGIGLNSANYFAFECNNSTSFDLGLNAVLRTAANRFDADIVVDNDFCVFQNGVLTLTVSPKYEYGPNPNCHADPMFTSHIGNTFTWNLNGISVTEPSKLVHITLWATNNQILAPGDTVHTSIGISPVTGDLNPANNTIVREDTVTGPYDPNAVYVSPGSCVIPGTQLQYTVTFENMGNDTAHNIYIMDTLNNGFEMHTMKIIAASHLMNVSKLNSGGYNILKFEFPNIDLPDSSNPGRHGFVQYTIDTKNNYPIGSYVSNKAGIFFDYMPAVLTNVSQTEMCWPASVTAISHRQSIAVYPNPASGTVTIESLGQSNSFTITNNIGQVLKEDVLKEDKEVVDISQLIPGIYYITIKGDGIRETRKFVKQ
ncbi:MAG: T9SS type A sorting domain-containing protein [Flavipsychrobacter sp.]|nr:T9SS type A sorting domain-containing protein [Flavipsychrobacter sp.]